MKLGKLAAWTIFSTFDARNGAAFAQRIEHWGYDALWIPEAFGRDPLIGASWILANTTKLNVATGIANIYARDSLATVNAQYALAEQSEDRFLLGVGVSHIPLVEGVRRHKLNFFLCYRWKPEQRQNVEELTGFGISQEAEATKSEDASVRVSAAKFWLSRRSGWKETTVTEHIGKDGQPIDVRHSIELGSWRRGERLG